MKPSVGDILQWTSWIGIIVNIRPVFANNLVEVEWISGGRGRGTVDYNDCTILARNDNGKR
jgi:hypothetical protein